MRAMEEVTVEVDADRLRALLTELIDIYSPSGKEEEIVDFLAEYAERHGLPVRRQEVDERRENLIVAAPGAQPRLALVAHVDTVPAYDLDEYAARDQDDRICGLGAADMKGGLAAMVEAFVAFADVRPLPGSIALCLVVGEEEYGDGAETLLEEMRFPWAVVGEPTELTPCLAHDGYLEIELSTRGNRMHAALAERGQTAIAAMLSLVQGISEHIDEKRPELVYNIRDLYSAGGGFVVPERCAASLDIHLPPGTRIGVVVAELEQIADTLRARSAEVEVDLRVETVDAGFDIPESGPLVAALRAVYEQLSRPWRPGVFRSHSDANQLWSAGVRSIVLGPGSLRLAHVPEESVSFEEVSAAAGIYLGLLERFVGPG